MHFVLGSRVVMARSSSSRAPGVFFSFLTSARIAFSHNLLWLRMACEFPLFKWDVVDEESIVLDEVLTEETGDAASPNVGPLDAASYGLTLKPRSFLTMAGVMHKFEKWVVNIDILLWCWVVASCLLGIFYF